MLLSSYQHDLLTIIQKYVNDGWILSFDFSVDVRSSSIGFIKGNLAFLDGSCLFFKEYVDLQDSIDKLSYSFHYQDHANHLVFRYDNAKHKPELGYADHKHIHNEIIASPPPNLEQVILEIIGDRLTDTI